jgi:molybdopterin-guanine dinucleotide biosynthesis protein B
VRDTHRDLTVAELVENFMDGVDVVLTEDYHRERWPKVEVHRRATGKPLRCAGDETLVALVSDEALPVDIPIFGFDQIPDVARLLLERERGASPDGPRD